MKAIVLTYAPITRADAELLKKTDIFKIACNDYCAELRPDLRLCVDDVEQKCLKCDVCDVVSFNYKVKGERIIDGRFLPARNSSLLSCIDYLLINGYTDVLLIADNKQTDHTTIKEQHKNKVNKGIEQQLKFVHLYKYTKDGDFDLPFISIKEFLTMTEENLILGVEETAPKAFLNSILFSETCRFRVHTEGLENYSIETGAILDSLLPYDKKAELLNGATKIEYNGLIIERITCDQKKEEKTEEPRPKQMSYFEMKEFVKKNNIPVISYKKEDLIEAIYG